MATWPEQELLPSLRASLADADSALLCVAFANQKGVNLLGPQLKVLGRVKRSSAVCTLLARLPGVEVVSTRPIALRLVD